MRDRSKVDKACAEIVVRRVANRENYLFDDAALRDIVGTLSQLPGLAPNITLPACRIDLHTLSGIHFGEGCISAVGPGLFEPNKPLPCPDVPQYKGAGL